MSTDPEKVVADGRYQIVDSFGDPVERTNDWDYAVQRANTNDGWIDDTTKSPDKQRVYDSEDQ